MIDKKVALVTGSARGIGFEIARHLFAEGYFVVISDIGEPSAVLPSLDAIDPTGKDVMYVRCDISNAGARDEALKKIDESCGRLDLLVNNAGIACPTRLDILETTEDSFDLLMRINLKGTFFMCQTFANYMIGCLSKGIEGYEPRIVNIASMSSYTSSTNRGEYCISKAGISMVTALFADKLAAHGIGVFEIRPGIIATDMTSGVKEKYDNLIAGGVTPIKRWGYPSDIAKAVTAVSKGLLDFSTGQVINVDGGFHLRRI